MVVDSEQGRRLGAAAGGGGGRWEGRRTVSADPHKPERRTFQDVSRYAGEKNFKKINKYNKVKNNLLQCVLLACKLTSHMDHIFKYYAIRNTY